MLVPDVLAIFHLDSVELDRIKNQACFHLNDNSYVVKPGIKASIRYLRELFAKKINEYYYPNSKHEIEVDIVDNNNNAEVSTNDNVIIGQKRSASSSSTQQISNKRGRK